MACGIIGLPQVGKTSLFQILTGKALTESHSHGETQHIGTVSVPDDRLDRLSKLFSPPRTIFAKVEYADVAAISKDTLKETGYLATLRIMDALLHVVRVFRDDSVAHVKGSIDPKRDIADVELDLILADLGIIENRLERLEKDRKKGKTPELEREQGLLEQAKKWLESERPLRELRLSNEEKKRLRGFQFLSEKPMLFVLNVGEEEVANMDAVVAGAGLGDLTGRPQTLVTAVSAKIEAELAMMSESDAAEFLKSYGLSESGRTRLLRSTFELLGFIVFFTVGEEECRAWTIPLGATAVQAAGAIHSDLAKHFIRAEVVPWNQLLEAGSLAAARQQGVLRLEGKEYVVRDGEMVHIRHSG
jgi:ribosome-binding ATPase